MEPTRFDALTRRLATGTSRRSVLRGLVAGLLAGIGLAKVAAADTSSKITLCHQTGSASNPWVLITVAQPAATTHLANGDTYPNSDGTCGDCQACAVGGGTTCDNPGCCTALLPDNVDICSGPYCQLTSEDQITAGSYTITVLAPGYPFCGWHCDYGVATCDESGCICPSEAPA